MAFPPLTGDVRDDVAWEAYLAEHLSAEQVGILERGWERSRVRFDAWRDDKIRPLSVIVERNWKLDVLAIDVELKPAGRAVLRLPPQPAVKRPPKGESLYSAKSELVLVPPSYHVEILWVKVSKAKRGEEPTQQPKSVRVVGEPIVTLNAQPDLNDFFTAFFLAVSGTGAPATFRRAPRARPAPGQDPDLDFYAQLVAAEKALIAAGSRHPAKELAERYPDVQYATVRAWLSRGRKYLRREDDDD